ncbi:ABC transporter substrate-binding protein [Massiliimalia massiliensis]|uniref:ABC transporter substrate-binding protein n=1 Tax=Massiliimalia massiliensis TaxID=1852384 RepID=UPI00098445FF|nr:extracellular solute-binding protein [Massiliimalia massiliensis]
MKKLFALLLAQVMVLGMASCGEKAGGGTSSTGNAASNVAAGEGPTVTIWECNWGGDAYEGALKKQAQRATDENIDGKGIKVETSMVAWDNYYDTFLTAVVSKTAPDIACEASTGCIQYADMGEALDLMPIYDAWVAEGSPIVDEVGQAAFDFETFNGELIGLPFSKDGTGLFYNKELFEGAGITELPTTWDEFMEVCDKLLAKYPEVVPFAFAGSDFASLTNVNDLFMMSNGASILTKDLEPNLQSDKYTEIMGIIKEMYDKGYIGRAVISYTGDDIKRMMNTGETAVILTNAPTWVAEDMQDKIGVMNPVKGPSVEEPYIASAFQAYHAFNQTENPEETLAVLKWWYENNDILYTEGGNGCIPIRASQQEKVMTSELVREYANVWLNAENSYPNIYPVQSFYPFHTTMDAEGTGAKPLNALLAGDDYQATIDQVCDEISEIIEDAGY